MIKYGLTRSFFNNSLFIRCLCSVFSSCTSLLAFLPRKMKKVTRIIQKIVKPTHKSNNRFEYRRSPRIIFPAVLIIECGKY